MPSQQSSNYDPRRGEWDGIAIDSWEVSLWKQWKPKQTTDDCVKQEREYLRVKHLVIQANTALSLDRVKIKLKLTTYKSIGLQGTFPCKLGDIGKNGSPNKQYTLSLGFAANDLGVKAAITKARELDLLLVTKQFQWTPELLGKQAQKTILETEATKLIHQLIQEYEREFWKVHERNRQGLRTWESHYLRHLKKLPQDVPISLDALETALSQTQPNTVARFYLVWQLKKFCNFCNFDADKLISSYATPLPSPSIRKIPSDEEVIAGYHQIGTPLSPYASKDNRILPLQWQWIYGMLATYGLRPHELFAVDIGAFTDPGNTFHLVSLNPSLTAGTKTGERSCGIPPLYPHWVELFDLKNVKLPSYIASLSNQTAKIQIRFRNVNLGFRPYDLRHGYAIRGHRLRVPMKTMADYMGHTVQEHTKTYQRWMNQDTNLEIYREVVLLRQGTSKEVLKERIKELELENLTLKAENETLRGLLVNQQLEEFLNSRE
ncbi:integrase [Calothrix sp. 336/3]|uniref:integrase n=1 Tax=Calothrix sp. 336/3 TaxID=1337936 RepID=UPI0004E4684D|nr:integrase [Calothrix sp. 336/3]AKG20193.1 integrase [Calothrix sp. 336/3]